MLYFQTFCCTYWKIAILICDCLVNYMAMMHMIVTIYFLFFHFTAIIDDSERLRPEELNQQNIEALVAESNLVHPANFLPYEFVMIVNPCRTSP